MYWVLMPAGSSTGSVLNPTEPRGTEIFKIVQGSAVDQALSSGTGNVVSIAGKKWQQYMVGSFPTLAAAKAASPPSGLAYIGTIVGAGAAAAAGGATGNTSGVGSAASAGGAAGGAVQTGLNAIGDFFARLTEANTWLRIGEGILGIVLIAVGIARMTGAVPAATAIAKKVGTVGVV